MRIFAPLAGLLLALAGPAAGQVVVTPNLTLRTAPDAVDVAALFEQRYGRTLELLEAEFPDDHAALVDQIAEIDRQVGDERQLLLAAFERLTEVRRKYAPRLRFAPSLSHSVMLGRIADFHDLVLDNEGPQVCARFAHDGSGVLFELGLSGRYANALDLQSLAYFDAVVRAIETPEYTEPVATDDWTAVLRAMVAAGAPASFLRTITTADRNDPDLCRALAAMFRTSGLLSTPEAARARADFASNLTGY
jgi:hypothetical protein